MVKRYARAAITRELSHSDTKPIKTKIMGKMSTVTVGNLNNQKRLVRVKRKGAKGDADFLVDLRAKTVSCVVGGNVVNLLTMSHRRAKSATPTMRVGGRVVSKLPPASHRNNWGKFAMRMGYFLAAAGMVWVVCSGMTSVIGAVDNVIVSAVTIVDKGVQFGNVMAETAQAVANNATITAGKIGDDVIRGLEEVNTFAYMHWVGEFCKGLGMGGLGLFATGGVQKAGVMAVMKLMM